MDEREFKETAKRLREVSTVIEKLDPTLRDDAWEILRPYISTDRSSTSKPPKDQDGDDPGAPPSTASEDHLIEQFEGDKDADNLYLTLAILYKRHGRGPFSMEFLKTTANALDLAIPSRPDTTFRNSTRKVVRKQEGGFKIQPSGERWLKEKYGVTKGKKALPDGS